MGGVYCTAQLYPPELLRGERNEMGGCGDIIGIKMWHFVLRRYYILLSCRTMNKLTKRMLFPVDCGWV